MKLAQDARDRVEREYYENGPKVRRSHRSLTAAITECDQNPIIAELKYASPSLGNIRKDGQPAEIARAMLAGGAKALSVVTDPDNFQGGTHVLAEVAEYVDAPVIMKDVIVSPAQLEVGSGAGADAVVLISEIFSRNLAEVNLGQMMGHARGLGLEVLVETNDPTEFEALRKQRPDLYGVNNRNLSTFQVELSTTEKILALAGELDRPVVSESGIESREDVRRLKKAGADAFLVGTSIMRSPNIEAKVRELVTA